MTTASDTSSAPAPEGDDLLVALTRTIDTHLEGYACADPVRRSDLVATAWHPDGVLADPPFEGRGHAEIAALTDVVLAHYADHRFVRTSAVDAHHGVARYAWQLVGPDGTVAVAGLDVAELADDGRLRRIVGFFGDLPRA